MAPKHSHGSPEVTTDIWHQGCECRYVGVQTGAGAQTCPIPGSLDMTTDMSSDTGAQTGWGEGQHQYMTKERPTKTPMCPETWEIRQEHMCSDTGRNRRPRTGTWKPGGVTPRVLPEQDPECWNVQPGSRSDVPMPSNGPSHPQPYSSTQTQTRPDPRLTSSPGSPGSPARPASPCIERVVRVSSHPTVPLPAQCTGPAARPTSPSRLAAPALLGHLWLPVDTGVRRTHGCQGHRQLRLKEGA